MQANKVLIFTDWNLIDYKLAWEKQELLLAEIIRIKTENRENQLANNLKYTQTPNYLIFCEHNPVFTLGKSGNMANLLLNKEELNSKQISFFQTNRGGDITFHGHHQIVGYPIIDLENFTADIGLYMRNLEQVIINTLAYFNIYGERSKGETGVWLDIGTPKARKICAMGVRTSRWVTMHGWALNVNTDLSYFNMIVPCGITNKGVTSMQKELESDVDINLVKDLLKTNFSLVFNANY
jgi:lipoyl(octanoyl) transferase